ncbi:MAG: hypothetical protein ACFFCW_01795 [Candidatus Hodarchaeota archaeon]
MEKGNIVDFIQKNIGVTGAPGIKDANDGYELALSDLATMPHVPWNKEAVTFDTTTSATYELGSDILTDYPNVRGIISLWHNETTKGQIRLVADVNYFNSYARTNTQSGAPILGIIHGRKRILELWPTPDSAYTLWAYIRFPLALEDVPEEFHMILVWLGVMNIIDPDKHPAMYAKAEKQFSKINNQITAESATRIAPDRIVPEVIYGYTGSTLKRADTGNWWGGLGR